MAISIKNVFINETARVEEITAYLVLKDFFFKDKLTVIGDDVVNGGPDIMSFDKTIGFEITTCATEDTYNAHSDRTGTMDITKLGYPTREAIVKSREFLKMAKPPKSSRVYRNLKSDALKIYKTDEYLFFFGKALFRKFDTLNSTGNYSTPNTIGLLIMSDVLDMPDIDMNLLYDKYDKISQLFEKQFDYCLVYVNNKIYNLATKSELYRADINKLAPLNDELAYNINEIWLTH